MPHSKELNGSVFNTVTAHTETLEEHDSRISTLEQADKLRVEEIQFLTKEFADISSNFTRMENTILKSAQATQQLMSDQNTQQWKLIEALNSGNQEDKARKHELTKTRMEKFWEFAGKIVVILLGSGGFFYVLLETLSK